MIGVVVAFGSIGFRIAIGWVQSAFYGFSSDDVFTLAGALPWWQVLLAPAAGGLLIGLFIHYAMPGRRPLGVAHVITAGAHSGGRMSLRQGLSAAAVDAASLGVGGSAGREGPMVHLGAGLVVGAIAIFFPQVLGVGYEATDAALNEQFALWLFIALIVAKTVATAATLGSGFGGGVFSPSLFLGAMTGGAFGIIAANVFPELAASHGLYAIIGMGAVAAPVLGAPISTILILFELTGDYAVTVAAMIAVAVASIATHQLLGRSYFTWQLERQGLTLKGGRPRHLLRTSRAADLMSAAFHLVPHDTPIPGIRERVQAAPEDTFFVVDDKNHLAGTLGLAELMSVAFDPALDDLVNARDLARPPPALVAADDSLKAALEVFDTCHAETVPVVGERRNKHVVGVLRHRDVLLAYNQALRAAQAEEHDEAR